MMTRVRHGAMLMALVGASLSAQAQAATVRLIKCGAEDCLLVRGHRASADATVHINERAVEARGGRAWQVRLPVTKVRDWSAPFARTLAISVVNPAGSVEQSEVVRLPVGLLGHELELASLVVHAP